MMARPADDEFEVTVIGPCFGESIVVHLGDQRWVIVDSTAASESDKPAPLKYLESIGVDPSDCVKLVVVTHWHDDHIRGISQVIDACSVAGICVPAGFTRDEFLYFLAAHADPLATSLGTGVDEVTSVFGTMRKRKLNHFAIADKRLLKLNGAEASHGETVEVWALSPSSFQVAESLGKMSALVPGFGQTKRRAVPTAENDHSIAMWISFGTDAVLLGGDLEETADVRAGWSAVVLSTTKPDGRATLFKVPHHGSVTGHNLDVWESMLSDDPHAVVTPWNRSRKLPSAADLDRLAAFSSKVHLTAPPVDLSRVKHDHEVEKLLRGFGIRTYRDVGEIGLVTARKRVGDAEWSIHRSKA
jgi:beta-lactamase superfamily II metal-dependent hydrolase